MQRVTFTEITSAAISAALASPRTLSYSLVDAYLARRALDFLVGFNISPVLWRKLRGAKSAGPWGGGRGGMSRSEGVG